MKKLIVPIYNVTLWLSVTELYSEKAYHYRQAFGTDPTQICEEALRDSGATHIFMDANFALFFKKDPPRRFVVHEVFHLTHRILDFCGVTFDRHNHEAAAYLHEYLFEQVMEELQS